MNLYLQIKNHKRKAALKAKIKPCLGMLLFATLGLLSLLLSAVSTCEFIFVLRQFKAQIMPMWMIVSGMLIGYGMSILFARYCEFYFEELKGENENE